jgi:hypothetical protein
VSGGGVGGVDVVRGEILVVVGGVVGGVGGEATGR